MCEFISWIEVERNGKKEILYLDDQLLSEKRTRELLKGSKDNDFLGHHAIRAAWNLKDDEGKQGEVRDFWNTQKLPKELRAKLRDFPTFQKNFGKMFESYAQPDDLSYVVKNAPGSWKKLKDLCLAPFLKDAKTKTLKVNARYDLSINELVKASKQDYVNPDITDQHFPTKKCPATKKEMVLLHLNKNVSAKVTMMVMKQLKLRPGTVKELLSLSIDDPSLEWKFLVIAPGSVWRRGVGSRLVPCLWVHAGDRSLNLRWYEGDWCADGRFLCARV